MTQSLMGALPDSFQQQLDALGLQPSTQAIIVDARSQTMRLYSQGRLKKIYHISTAKAGLGSSTGSYQTPLGMHRVREKIGAGKPKYAIFRARQYTGGQWDPREQGGRRGEDLILSRILRLEGLEEGLNRGKGRLGLSVDSHSRYIYIHGTNDEEHLGEPSSMGCVRMGNEDVIDLFRQVPQGTLVWITTSL